MNDGVRAEREVVGVRTEHEVVGKRFHAYDSGIYVVTRWERPAGYWVRLVIASATCGPRVVGDTTCISERAIGRTFHDVYEWNKNYAPPIPHEAPCNCYVCEKRPA